MKNTIVLSVLLCVEIHSIGQGHFTTNVPCSDSLLMTIKGSYEKVKDVINPSSSTVLSKAQQPETFSRMATMHQLLLEAYPQPVGMDGKWNFTLESDLFSPDVTGSTGTRVCGYRYSCVFGSNTCYQDRPMDVAIYSDVYNILKVYVNEPGDLMSDLHMDTMSIGGQKVFMLNPLVGSWKGYDMYGGKPGNNFRCVILSRKSETPFIPVTRKQYLEYSVIYLDQLFEKQIQFIEQMPVRSLADQEAEKKQALDKIDEDNKNNEYALEAIRKNFLETYKTEQQRNKETVDIIRGQKVEVINTYKMELAKARAGNMLDAPAEVNTLFEVNVGVPIFYSGSDGGRMLVVENPSYFRQDLPRYVPQFMVLYWEWVSDFPMYGGAQGVYYRKMIEENFPIEKLQEMIDR